MKITGKREQYFLFLEIFPFQGLSVIPDYYLFGWSFSLPMNGIPGLNYLDVLYGLK